MLKCRPLVLAVPCTERALAALSGADGAERENQNCSRAQDLVPVGKGASSSPGASLGWGVGTDGSHRDVPVILTHPLHLIPRTLNTRVLVALFRTPVGQSKKHAVSAVFPQEIQLPRAVSRWHHIVFELTWGTHAKSPYSNSPEMLQLKPVPSKYNKGHK